MRRVLKKNLGMTLVIALITILGGVALVVRSAGATVTVDSGHDTFTTPNNAQTFDDFASHPIPAGTVFGPGSQEFNGRVTFKGGAPINPSQFGTADTVIKRLQSVQVPGDTALEVIGISFVSASPITVNYANGSTTCNVSVSKSTVRTSGGTMHFNADGTFTSSLTIYPKYTFNCGNGNYTHDTGSTGSFSINLSSTNGTWSQSGRVTVINPGSEQDLLASHNVVPAPPPCPPTPHPTATAVPGGPVGGIDRVDSSSESLSARSASSANLVAVTPCLSQATLDHAVDAQAVQAQP
jgi:hypothetical protein